MKKQPLRSLEQLKDGQAHDIVLVLMGSLISRKNIEWDAKKKTWYVYNGIDGSYQTVKDLERSKATNIPLALKNKALFLDD